MNKVYYVGLDVHKDSIQMAVLDDRKKEPIVAKGLPNRVTRVVKELAGYQKQGEVRIACEAGCPGYTLCRELTAFGFDCRVILPNTVFHGGDGAIKTDYRDAADIAWMLRRNEGESMAAPTAEDEAARDVIRCRGDLMENLKGMKQRLLKFLLGKGVNYESERYRTGKRYQWLRGLKLREGLEQMAMEEYPEEIRRLEDKIGRLDKKVEEIAKGERYEGSVRKLLHEKYTRLVFKGKSKQAAITAVERELAGFIRGVMKGAA